MQHINLKRLKMEGCDKNQGAYFETDGGDFLRMMDVAHIRDRSRCANC